MGQQDVYFYGGSASGHARDFRTYTTACGGAIIADLKEFAEDVGSRYYSVDDTASAVVYMHDPRNTIHETRTDYPEYHLVVGPRGGVTRIAL